MCVQIYLVSDIFLTLPLWINNSRFTTGEPTATEATEQGSGGLIYILLVDRFCYNPTIDVQLR